MPRFIAENVVLGRQISRATCWAGTVAAVGRALCPESKTTGTALVVAEGIRPQFRKINGELEPSAVAAYAEAWAENPRAAHLMEANLDKRRLKEQRNVADMLEKHFPVSAVVENFAPSADTAQRDALLRTVLKNVQKNRPVLLGVRTTEPFLPVAGGAPYFETHVLLCYGLLLESSSPINFSAGEPLLLCKDPAHPDAENFKLEIPLSKLFTGFPYIKKEDLGPMFKESFSNVQDFSMHLHQFIYAELPNDIDTAHAANSASASAASASATKAKPSTPS